ncbi:MAG: hypothetical protein PHD76_14645 [Methylacidiphilales bacterium]|nr:hypothetical protein [Candidatus Methylacidiphilales bacterium]
MMTFIDIYILIIGFFYPLLNGFLAVILFLGHRRRNLPSLQILCFSSAAFASCGIVYAVTRLSFYHFFLLPEHVLKFLFILAMPFELAGMILSVVGISMLCFMRRE